MDEDRLSRGDEETVGAALAEAGEPRTLPELIAGWEGFVGDVERGFEGSFADYLEAVAGRDRVERVGSRLTIDGCLWLARRLAPLDARFLGSTRSLGRAIAPEVGEDAPPWWFRLPRELSPSLRDGLAAAGLVAQERT